MTWERVFAFQKAASLLFSECEEVNSTGQQLAVVSSQPTSLLFLWFVSSFTSRYTFIGTNTHGWYICAHIRHTIPKLSF